MTSVYQERETLDRFEDGLIAKGACIDTTGRFQGSSPVMQARFSSSAEDGEGRLTLRQICSFFEIDDCLANGALTLICDADVDQIPELTPEETITLKTAISPEGKNATIVLETTT